MKRFFTTALILLLSVLTPLMGANVTWTGDAGDRLWSTDGNWDSGAVPTASDKVVVNAGTEEAPVTIATGTTASPLNLNIGSIAGSVGVLSIDGTFSMSGTDHVYVGNAGSGILKLQGSFSIPRQLYIGYTAGSEGVFLVNGGVLDMGRDIFIGNSGTGRLEVVSGMAASRYFGVGELSGSDGTVVVQEGASIQIHAGTNGSAIIGKNGRGRIHLRGGTASPSATYFQLIIRQDANAFGMLHGWGTWNTGNKVALDNSGLVIADGEGEERRLAINAAGTNCSSANSIDNDSTNGWYAVNGGQLYVDQRVNVIVGDEGVCTWGDANSDDVIDMVNSARITFYNIGGKNGILSVGGTICAANRTEDYMAALPSGATKIGNWKFALSNGGSCSSYDIELRYDHVAASGLALKLKRWNGTAWADIDDAVWNAAAYTVKVTGLVPDSSTAVGTFAIVGVQAGTCILFR